MLVVDSSYAAASDWVRREIAVAIAMREASKGRAPTRVFGVLLEGFPPRTELDQNELHLEGATRRERELAVQRAIKTER